MLSTVCESSRFEATSTHAQVMSYVRDLEAAFPRNVHRASFGRSPGGRELPLLVLSPEGLSDPVAARATGRPVVLFQCCIHAGEVEGKEAALMLARDLLSGPDAGLLEQVTLVLVPLFNPDGNDAMDPSHRALQIDRLRGQNGPKLTGTRVNAAGINLNRDYIRHGAEEMRLLQRNVCQVWRPDLTVDTHATNGSVHRFAMTMDIPHTEESGRREPIEYMRQVLVPEVTRAVRSNAGFDSGWYGNFVEDERVLDAGGSADPASIVREGWMTYPHHPRFGSNYRGLSGRLDLLLECYSYLGFEERVRVTYAWLLETLRSAAGRARDIRELVDRCQQPPADVAIRYRLETRAEPVDILTREPRTLDGKPVVVRLPFLAQFRGSLTVQRPSGYLVPARLQAFFEGHGIDVQPAPARARIEVPTLESVETAAQRSILEAAEVGRCHVSWKGETRVAPDGRLLVRTDQPLGALATYLCEPESDDGLVENGLLVMPEVGQALEVARVLQD